jgi:hypothetical protein
MSPIPLAGGAPAVVALVLATAHFLFGIGSQLHGINFVSFQQAATPRERLVEFAALRMDRSYVERGSK